MTQQKLGRYFAITAILLAACAPPTATMRRSIAISTAKPVLTQSPSTYTAEPQATPISTPTMRTVNIDVRSGESAEVGTAQATSSIVQTGTIAAPVLTGTLAAIDTTTGEDISDGQGLDYTSEDPLRGPLPVLSKGLSTAEIKNACGYGTVASFDGHELRSTPELPLEEGNRTELLAEGTKVFLIDCAVWIDGDLLPWLAVQTAQGKIGWMLVQPDKFYVQVLPVAQAPRRVTSVPPGTTVGYAPREECEVKDTSTEAQAASLAIDFVPVVGDAKGLQEAATGCDAITGEPLGDWRWLGLLGLVGVAELGALRHTDDVSDAARVVGTGDDLATAAGKSADDFTSATGHYADEAAPLGRSDETADTGKSADEVPGTAKKNTDEVAVAEHNADEVATVGRTVGAADETTSGGGKFVSGTDTGFSIATLTARGYTPDEAVYIASKFEQPCSFSADTEVIAENGSVPIREIKIGDRVLAYDETLRKSDYFTVTNVFTHLDPVILYLSIGNEQIETTPEHPFFAAGDWIAAGDLEPGDLLTSAFGTSVAVNGTHTKWQPQAMYNLTVTDAHTYFVGDGGWLVHNACSRKLRASFPTNTRELNRIRDYANKHGVDVPWQAHHVVPGQEEGHAFVKLAKESGWEIDDAVDNGIALPAQEKVAADLGLPAHRGSHGIYTSEVRARLDEELLAYNNAKAAGTPPTPHEIVQQMDKIVKDFRHDLSSGKYGKGTRLD